MELPDPADDLWSSLQELSEFDQAGSATHAGKFREQREKIQRLDAYCNQAIAELRASLDDS
jgi:hypothetical protein